MFRLLFAAAIALFYHHTAALGRDLERSMEMDGFHRTYTVFIPDRLQRGPFPTVIVLHGGLESGSTIRRQLNMDPVAGREGFVTVYPNGLGRGWNDGRGDRLRQRGIYGRAGDVAFLKAIVKDLVGEGIALNSRVFLTGVSNGGMMSLRMGCEAADLFAGISPIIASIPADIVPACAPSRHVPLLLINGMADPLVPWNGGGVGFAGRRGRVIPTLETIAFWRRVNGCSAEEKAFALKPAPGDGTGVIGKLYKDCRSGAPVALIGIEGGGHRIPGYENRAHPAADWLLGRQNHDFETAVEVWRFFRTYASR